MKRWNLILLLFVSIPAFAKQPPIWVIAHMTNSVSAVKWAADAGANGVEADLRFDENDKPAYFKHSEPCDCSCSGHADNMEVCKHLGGNPCLSMVRAADWFAAVVAQPRLGLVVIDSKVDKHTSPDAGKNLINTLVSELFDKGYNGMVIIGASKFEALPYLHAAAAAAKESKYANRMYFTLDGEGSSTVEVLRELVKLHSDNIVYGTGVTACLAKQFPNEILLGDENRRAGVIGFNYIWTIDKPKSVTMYLEKGAGGIMTNDPITAVTMVKQKRYLMASPGEFFPAATNTNVLTKVPKCDCSHRRGGCVITQPAPKGWACKCDTTAAPLTCSGSVVVCKNPDSPDSKASCGEPSDDKASCEQGGGNCHGYR